MSEPLTPEEEAHIRWRIAEGYRFDGYALIVDLLATLDAARSTRSNEGLAVAALRSITTVQDRVPAHRGKVVSHEVDEVHSPDEPCRFCDALLSEASGE